MDRTGRDNWETQLRKGMVGIAVLAALAEERRYGRDLIDRLSDVLGGSVGEGTIYPLLSRLDRDGLVETSLEPSPRGPARKYYELTAEGRATLAWLKGRWREISEGMDTLMEESDD